jgi:hypothetical protein
MRNDKLCVWDRLRNVIYVRNVQRIHVSRSGRKKSKRVKIKGLYKTCVWDRFGNSILCKKCTVT